MSKLTDIPELAPRVVKLWETRARLKNADRLNARAQEWLKAYAARDEVSVSGCAVVDVRTQVRKPYRRFATERLKRNHPKEYERCRLLVPQHSVRHLTATADIGDYGSPLAELDPAASLAEMHKEVRLSLAYAEKLRLRPIIGELKQTEDQLKSELESVVAYYIESGKWNGESFTFEDGWVYGARIRKFSADEAIRLLAADVVETYSELIPEQVIEQVHAVGERERRYKGGPDGNPFEGN